MFELFLKNILDYKRGLVGQKRDFYNSLKRKAQKSGDPHVFKAAISASGQTNLIAEIKKASPSRGLIRKDFDPIAIAKVYAANDAAAISILTEDKYFQGQPEFINDVSNAVQLPILAKDFIIDEGQIYEACTNGAGAVLLIVAVLDDRKLKALMDVAGSLGLDCLVEVHNKDELKRAVGVGAEIIGINNRDLCTFEVDVHVCMDLIPKIPSGKVIVAESGFKTYLEIQALRNAGVHAVLIGETFMREEDIGKKIKEVMYGKS